MTLLIKDAEVVITMDANRREIGGGSVLVEGDAIAAVGTGQFSIGGTYVNAQSSADR